MCSQAAGAIGHLESDRMLFRQIVHEDLGCASYLVGDPSAGVAAVVDPQWDIEPYLRLSRLHGVRIEHVLETHNHADHVSGHGRLARATGATIHIHGLADAEYPHERVRRRLEAGARRGRDRGRAHPGPPARAHLVPAPRLEPRARSRWAVADRRLAVRRRRRPPRPRGRAARGGREHLPLAARAAVRASATSVEVWPGHLGGSLCGSSGDRPQDLLDDRLRARATTARSSSRPTRSFVADAVGDDRRPAAERRAHRRAQPRPAGRASSGPRRR